MKSRADIDFNVLIGRKCAIEANSAIDGMETEERRKLILVQVHQNEKKNERKTNSKQQRSERKPRRRSRRNQFKWKKFNGGEKYDKIVGVSHIDLITKSFFSMNFESNPHSLNSVAC